MRWRNKENRVKDWHTWFAWYPLVNVDGLVIWLECVERRSVAKVLTTFTKMTARVKEALDKLINA